MYMSCIPIGSSLYIPILDFELRVGHATLVVMHPTLDKPMQMQALSLVSAGWPQTTAHLRGELLG